MAIELNEMDKRTEIYPIRVPEITKHHLDIYFSQKGFLSLKVRQKVRP